MSQLVIHVEDLSVDPVQLGNLTDELRRSLLELNVDDARFARVPAPPETRGAEALEIATIVVQLAVESRLVSQVVETISGWLQRTHVNQVEIAIGDDRLVLSAASPEQEKQLVEHFIRVTGTGRALEK